MKPASLKELAKLSQAVQDADAAKLQSIRAEEARIRAQLAALDARHKEARNLPIAHALPHHRLGGDVLWQVWVGRRRRDLQMQLARCLARQGAVKRALQKSFGKRFALENAQDDLRAKLARAAKIKAFDQITEMSVLQNRRS